MEDTTKRIKLWGKEVLIKLVFSCDTILQVKQAAFDDFTRHSTYYGEGALVALKAYLQRNAAEVLAFTALPTIPDDIYQIVTVEAVKFYPSGAFAIFCDTSWDSHGLALYHENGYWEVMPPDQLWFRT